MILLLLMVSGISILSADDVSISGVDSRFLAVTGEVDLYAVATDESGNLLEGLEPEDFVLRDAPVGADWGEPRPVTGFSASGERRDGISFLLLIDDSASMYDDAAGDETADWANTRAALARNEARRFLEDLGSSMDRAGLAEFGTGYRLLAGPRTDRASLTPQLESSDEPVTEEAYTELYAALARSAGTLEDSKGRRIVILFSDGVNFPFAEKRGEPHPEYGMQSWTPDDSLKALREEAVTLYAVRFGTNRDGELARIAASTGGQVFDVEGEEELAGLYAAIRERVLSEYMISYRPRPTGAVETRLGLSLTSGSSEGELSYLSGFVLGEPSDRNQVLLSLLVLPIVALILLVLLRMKAAESLETPSLGRLRPQAGESATVALESGKTVIAPGAGGSGTVIASPDAAGSPSPSSKGTIIVEKGSDGNWRASGGEGVIVNNRKVESTILENGDVIRAGEELIVFDDGNS